MLEEVPARPVTLKGFVKAMLQPLLPPIPRAE